MSNKPTDPASLRAEAEARVARASLTLVNPQPGEDLLHELLHELRVHQIELEMQSDELRRAQLIIEESRDRYVDLYEFAPVGYLTLTREGLIAEVNLTGAALLEVDRKKLLKRRFAGFINPDDKDRWHRHFLYVLQHDGRQSCELELQRGDDSRFHVQVDCLHMKDGEISSVRIALTDISARKQADEGQCVAAIAFAAKEGMMITDANAVILRVNQAFTRLTGYSEEEAAGKTPEMLKSGHHDPAFYQQMWADLEQKHYWHGEIWNKLKDGNICLARLSISAVIAPDGGTSHYVCIYHDTAKI